MSGPSCGDCRYGQPTKRGITLGWSTPEGPKTEFHESIECHRYPPAGHPTNGNEWPVMWPSDWCGEHQPRPAPPEPTCYLCGHEVAAHTPDCTAVVQTGFAGAPHQLCHCHGAHIGYIDTGA